MQRFSLPVVALLLALAALVAAPSPGSAAVLDYDGAGTLRGARHVEVDGRFYDVRFADRTCIADFFGCNATTDFAFRTEAQAVSAARALGEQVFIDTALFDFDSEPTRTLGCSGSTQCQSLIPFNSVGGNAYNTAFFNNRMNLPDLPYDFFDTVSDQYGVAANDVRSNLDLSTENNLNYVIFRPEPFPITFIVEGSGPQNSVSGWFTLSSDILEGSAVLKDFGPSAFDFHFQVTIDGKTYESQPGAPAIVSFLDANDQPDQTLSLTFNDGGAEILFISLGNPVLLDLFDLADGNRTVLPNLDYTVFSFYDDQGNLLDPSPAFNGTLSITAIAAVPEAESMPLLVSGLAGFAALRRRKGRRARR